MIVFLITIASVGVIVIIGLAFNVIRPSRYYVWISDNPFDKEYESHHKNTWRDSH